MSHDVWYDSKMYVMNHVLQQILNEKGNGSFFESYINEYFLFYQGLQHLHGLFFNLVLSLSITHSLNRKVMIIT